MQNYLIIYIYYIKLNRFFYPYIIYAITEDAIIILIYTGRSEYYTIIYFKIRQIPSYLYLISSTSGVSKMWPF